MVQGGLKKVQGGLEPPLAPHFPRLCVQDIILDSGICFFWIRQFSKLMQGSDETAIRLCNFLTFGDQFLSIIPRLFSPSYFVSLF